MKIIRCFVALAALACLSAGASAQTTYKVGPNPSTPSAITPTMSVCFGTINTAAVCVDQKNGLPMTPASASSTACVVSATTTAATATNCRATGSVGTYSVGPFVPQAGYPVRIVATGTWSGSIAIGTSVDNCATVNPLTVAGQTYGTYTGNANEAVDVPVSSISIGYCMSITVTSGTLSAALRQ